MWVKICGVNSLASAENVVAAGPDAIGLNFYAGSKRFVEAKVARDIVETLPQSITPVGLFVNHSLVQIRELCQTCSLSTIQLHGDETLDFVQQLSGLEIIKAFRVHAQNHIEILREIHSYAAAGIPLRACLIDAAVSGAYGGTGQTAPWDLLGPAWQQLPFPVILAGGLSPGNVAEAIQRVQPWGVDVAGGVESSPGMKDATLSREFVRIARSTAAGMRKTHAN